MVNFSDLQLHDMEPVYVQIVRHLKRAIFLGEAAVGESLPSRRELAAHGGRRAHTDTEKRSQHGFL